MLNKLEKKFGKYAIPNLTTYLIGGFIIGYLLQFGDRYAGLNITKMLTLEPYYIIHNYQLWRLVSWVLIPPNASLIWAIFMFFLYYQLGTALEKTWGTFRFNVFLLGGILYNIIGAFVIYFINGGVLGVGYYFSTYYICMSLFLAFAICFPDLQILLYFIIPVKMKWMAIFYAVIFGYDFFIATGWNSVAWAGKTCMLASLINVIIFYLSTKRSPKQIHRQREFKRQATPPPTHDRHGSPVSRHKCAVCGRTELTNPELEFRFCSKCNGNYEYCSDHLFTHQHIEH